uniref:Aldedh domain-containing protein n=1 Tax=Bursaphelenchus xylophilus TaxID=6326 RepID=A0A1I7RSD3_BURXY
MFCFPRPVPGDLIFFCRNAVSQEFEAAVLEVAVVDSNVYHVALVVDREHVVHALPDRGVVQEPISSALRSLSPDYIELASLDVDTSWKERACEKAKKEVDQAFYNDLFSWECLDSQNRRAFYCCQLVVWSYYQSHPDHKNPFLAHQLNFKNADGVISEFWINYYRQRGRSVPQDEPGSHPSKLRISPGVQIKASRPSRMSSKLSIPRTFLKNLHYVNGSYGSEGLSNKFVVYEPRSGEVLTEIGSATTQDVHEVVQVAKEGQKKWAQLGWQQRGEVLRRSAVLIRENVDLLADWEVRDNGKPINEAIADVLSCAETLDFFSNPNLAGQYLPYDGDDQKFAYTKREPLGVVGAIGAWNYPIQTASWKIVPAIACGNSIIYKPSPLTPVTTVLLAEILTMAGIPDGVVNIVQGEADTGTAICKHPDIRKVSFTGSVATGKRIAQNSNNENIKPVTLELGGKSACVIFDDADIEVAVHGAMMANFYSQGQVCSNASKVFVHSSIIEDFTNLLVNKVKAMKIGDPLDKSVHVGASISEDHINKVLGYVEDAVKHGAKKLYGGEKVKVPGLEKGFYMSPCILDNVQPSMRAYREEIFGPVLLIIPFEDEEEVLARANETDYGLAAGVFTTDLKRAHTFANRLAAGNVYVNTFNDVSPWVPFGGYNQSGYGRENGQAAIEHYSQLKSIFMNVSGKLDNPFPSN